MAWAFVNGVTASAPADTNSIVAPAQDHTTGNTIIVFTSRYDSAGFGTQAGISDTAGNTYAKIGGDYGGDGNHQMEAWMAHNITGHASNVITVSLSVNCTFRVIGVIQYSGLHATAAYDASATGTVAERGGSESQPIVSNAVTTSTDDQVVLGFWVSWIESRALTSSGNSTLRVQEGAGAAVDDSAITEVTAATAGSYTTEVDEVANNALGYAVIVRSFKAQVDDPDPITDGPKLTFVRSNIRFN